MKIIPQAALLALFLASFPAFRPAVAQEMPSPAPAQGMHHLDVTRMATAPGDRTEPVPPVKKTADKIPDPVKTADKPPAPKALKPEEALKKTDTLVAWPYYTDLATVGNDTALESVLHQVQIDPGSVPPKGLLFIAKDLSERGRMDEAAFYYYAAQLRASFDQARFPPYSVEPVLAKKKDKRTEDQRGETPSPDTSAVLIDPHEPDTVLAMSIGPKISKWAMSDPSRLDTVMTKLRDWDAATPYAYLPDYDVSHAAPFEKWPQLLVQTRNDYFTRARQIAQGLTRLRPNAPAPSFGQR
jgi:hypothetical protein